MFGLIRFPDHLLKRLVIIIWIYHLIANGELGFFFAYISTKLCLRGVYDHPNLVHQAINYRPILIPLDYMDSELA